MKTGQERKDYWNQKYYEYWKSRVDESGGDAHESRIIDGDAKTEDDEIYESIFAKNPFNPGNLLEVGCAWGRMFRIYKEYEVNIYGVDISSAMIAAAKNTHGNDPQIKDMQESEAESVPYEDDFFDNVSCIATFDSTFQIKSLREFLRVLKIGGRLYVTGKSLNYFSDDQLSLDAEMGARSKGHPNFFTDVPKMLEMLASKGHKVLDSYYFPRRGDFAKNKYLQEIPEKFYEWFLIIEKGSEEIDFEEFAAPISKTLQQAHPELEEKTS